MKLVSSALRMDSSKTHLMHHVQCSLDNFDSGMFILCYEEAIR